MKIFVLITVGLSLSFANAFCQCPAPGLKIQTEACEDPRNLKVSFVSCSEMKVSWNGNRDRNYVLKASYIEPETGKTVEIRNAHSTSDKSGNFIAAIKVREGANVSWNVQATCLIENATVYSAEVKGADANIPYCQRVKNIISEKAINIYPNPASGYLNVEYAGKIEGTIEFGILDVSGKKVVNKVDGAVTKTGSVYTLDLRNLPPGTYVLEAVNGSKISQAKFVLLKN